MLISNARRAVFALAAAIWVAASTAADTHGAQANSLVVSLAWSRATPPGMTMGVGYFAVKNTGPKLDVLVGASSPRAQAVELHRTVEEQGVARMRPVASVDIAPGATVVAAPGGLHLMLVGLDGPLVAGESVPVTLQFRDAGAVAIELRVQPLDATAPTRTHH